MVAVLSACSQVDFVVRSCRCASECASCRVGESLGFPRCSCVRNRMMVGCLRIRSWRRHYLESSAMFQGREQCQCYRPEGIPFFHDHVPASPAPCNSTLPPSLPPASHLHVFFPLSSTNPAPPPHDLSRTSECAAGPGALLPLAATLSFGVLHVPSVDRAAAVD